MRLRELHKRISSVFAIILVCSRNTSQHWIQQLLVMDKGGTDLMYSSSESKIQLNTNDCIVSDFRLEIKQDKECSGLIEFFSS